ncbi:filamentous hemagglutinin N-terminal domain-containing protein [Pseudomonas sp. C27(2019)]|uniref:two-partner secretion domain-containing protein n=1 Tax=Pseudomonas sp. C27(2019) TaxID=2604941 RepID=UPI00124645FE|nr:filamentous hemagglutinin N-terminal domain-containing protein [Pseudomonas sp. C27(2019)]QEY58325.1 filamentous hemagglutinin N-terminal domain-containing protein [Pseudomonas sp. C27(2019)]
MNTQSRLFKIIAQLLIAVMCGQPLLAAAADLRVDTSAGGNTHISQAGNGVPVVNINTPNSKGLSHNKFTDYNVGQQGLILNNSTDKFTQTQLGGIIVGNSQLNGRAAGLILNEVTGGQASQLKGYTEVAGKQAHVVVANPHGITCDGCGFINTPHATLTTGKPIIEQGQLKRYDVEGGQIEISGAGLNASNISQFDLITRSAKINAELHANQLNIITGRNNVDAQTLTATAKADRPNDKPSLAIDSSALGGMYAGAIRLVGTEAGVGVKLAGDMAASAGDIQIDANGRLSLARTAAKGDIKLNAAQIDLTQDIYSEQSAQVTTKHGAINVSNSLAAAGDLDLDAALIDNHGVIESGANADGSSNTASTLTVQGGEFKNQGTVVAQGALNTDLNVLNNQGGQIVAVGAAQIDANHLDNSGGKLIGQQTLDLTVQTLDNTQAILASNQDLTIQASAQINNTNDGLILSQGGDLNISSSTINDQDAVLQANTGVVNITANRSLNNKSGKILANSNALQLNAQQLNNQKGVIQAHSVYVGGGDAIDNRQGQIIATAGDLQLSQAAINNDDGKLISQQNLTVDATSLTNQSGLIGGQEVAVSLTGHLNNNSGLIEATDTLLLNTGSISNDAGRLRALGETGNSAFTIKTLFNNDKGLLEVGNQSFLLNSQALSNQKGIVRHLGEQFALNLSDAGQAGGSFFTNGILKLDLDRWLNSSELQAEQIELNVNHFTNTASGVLRSIDDLHASGTTWVNDGQIETDGALHLSLSDSYTGKGALHSQGSLYINSQNVDLQQGASVRSAQNVVFELGGRLLNAGALSAAGDVQIRANDVDNQATLGAGQKLRIEINDLLNQGLLFSGADMALRSNTLTNLYGDIYSLGALTAAKDDAYTAMTALENRSGSIGSSGDMRLHAATLNNRKEQFRLGKTLTSGHIGVVCYDCSGDHHNVDYIATERFEFAVEEDSAAARIHSGGNLTAQGDWIANRYSNLSASGNISIIADTLENLAASTGTAQRVQRFNTGRVTDGTDERFRWNYIYPYNRQPLPKELPSALRQWRLVSDIETQTPTGIAAPAIIQAGGNVHIQARETINNASLLANQAPTAGAAQTLNTHVGSGSQPLVVQLNAQLPADLTQQVVDPTVLPGFSLPQSSNGLFAVNSNVNHPYLIETNPLFASMSGFLNSSYLLQGLGYDPEQAQKRLGDGLYEQRLIEQAVIARTGKRFLDGLTSNDDQFRYLMDNGIASKESLNLSLGISLTGEQVAALTHDIVWLEEREVQGEKVLVPILYLAQATDRVAPTGALIQGRDVALISGAELNNSGMLRARQNLSINAENISNSGLIQADERLQLLAQDSIHNQRGGLIKGRDVSLLAVTGDISNERTITQEARSGKGFSQTTSTVDQAAGIEAAHDLSLMAGRDIINQGANLKAGAAMELNAGRNVLLVSAEENNGQMRQDKRHFWSNSSATQHASEIQAGTQLNVSAEQGVAVVASRLKAGGDMSLQAVGDVLISSAANTQNSEYRYRRSDKKVNQESARIRQQASVLEAGGQFESISGADTQVVSSQINAGKEAYLVAGGKVQLVAEQDYDYSFYEEKKKGSFGRKSFKSDERTQITNIGSDIRTGSDLLVASGGEQFYQAAKLKSAADLILDSEAGIVFEGVKDLEQKSRIRSKSSWVWQSAKGKGSTDESLIQSQLQAQGEIAIRAAENIKIDIKEVNQQSVSQTIDAMVQADPQLAWLKEVEQRGDVDWRQVRELHDSFKYSSSGLGGPVAMVVAIVVAYFTAGAASGLIGGAAGATAGSGTAMAATGTATASAVASGATAGSVVTAGWANATISGVVAGAAGGAASAVSQGQDWRDAALVGGVTGGLASYLSAGTYYNNTINTASNIKHHIGSSEWMSLAKEVYKVGMNQAFGYAQSKFAKEIGLKPHELSWLLMTGSSFGNQWGSVGTRLGEQEGELSKSDGTVVLGVGNRKNVVVGLPFDAADILLGYQGLPDASVRDYLSEFGVGNGLSSGHSLGTLSNIYLASNGLAERVYLYSIPFGAVAPSNAEVMIGTGDLVNGGWLGKLFNWDAQVVPLKPWEHSFDNYKKYIKE